MTSESKADIPDAAAAAAVAMSKEAAQLQLILKLVSRKLDVGAAATLSKQVLALVSAITSDLRAHCVPTSRFMTPPIEMPVKWAVGNSSDQQSSFILLKTVLELLTWVVRNMNNTLYEAEVLAPFYHLNFLVDLVGRRAGLSNLTVVANTFFSLCTTLAQHAMLPVEGLYTLFNVFNWAGYTDRYERRQALGWALMARALDKHVSVRPTYEDWYGFTLEDLTRFMHDVGVSQGVVGKAEMPASAILCILNTHVGSNPASMLVLPLLQRLTPGLDSVLVSDCAAIVSFAKRTLCIANMACSKSPERAEVYLKTLEVVTLVARKGPEFVAELQPVTMVLVSCNISHADPKETLAIAAFLELVTVEL